MLAFVSMLYLCTCVYSVCHMCYFKLRSLHPLSCPCVLGSAFGRTLRVSDGRMNVFILMDTSGSISKTHFNLARDAIAALIRKVLLSFMSPQTLRTQIKPSPRLNSTFNGVSFLCLRNQP